MLPSITDDRPPIPQRTMPITREPFAAHYRVDAGPVLAE